MPERRLSIEENLLNSPRFGHSRQFSHLFSDNDETQNDYIQGICATGILIICFFLVWSILLCLFKCCMGKRRVGFLSGAPYDARTLQGEPNKRAVRGRMVFAFSGIMFMVFTVLLVFLGVANIEDTASELSDGAELSRAIFADAENVVDSFLVVANQTEAKTDEAFYDLLEVFEIEELEINLTKTTTEPIRSDSSNGTSASGASDAAKFVFDGINLQDKVKTVLVNFQQLERFIITPTSEVQSTLIDGERKCKDVRDGLNDVELESMQTGVMIPLLVIAGILILIMGLSIMGISNRCTICFTAWIMTPVFIWVLFVLLLWTGAMSVGGIVNADFCTGGQEQTAESTFLAIMEEKGIDRDSFNYRAVEYTIYGCEFDTPRERMPLQFVDEFETKLNATVDNIQSLLENFDSIGLQVLSRELKFNATAYHERLAIIRANSVEMAEKLVELMRDLSCQRLNEIYQKAIHEATCDESYSGLAWTFSSLLIMTFFGFLMLQFRAALYPLAGVKDDDDNYSWNEAKEKELAKGGAAGTAGDNEGAPVDYVQDEGLSQINNSDRLGLNTEAPMGGTAQERYETVGDDNPFADVSGQQETFAPRKSAWE